MTDSMIVANQRISAHLKWSEVRCKCGGAGLGRCDGGHVRWEVLHLFEIVRAHCSRYLDRDCPLYVSSGVRCLPYNLQKGSDSTSQHVKGMALDIIRPEGIPLRDFWKICDIAIDGHGGVGYYDWWRRNGKTLGGCHIDARGENVRWEDLKR